MWRLAIGLLLLSITAAPASAQRQIAGPNYQRAAELELLCQRGDIAACKRAGGWYSLGTFVPRDERKALRLYSLACDHGDAEACSTTGGILEATPSPGMPSTSLKPDPAGALKAYDRACDKGYAKGCRQAATIIGRGAPGVPQNLARAGVLLERACDSRDLEACDMAAQIHEGRGDHAAASKLLLKACDGGPKSLAAACAQLGANYATGQGVPADPAKGKALSRLACEHNAMLGCHNLGLMLAKDEPVEAAKAFTKACSLGEADSCANLASLTASGRGLAKDLARATSIGERACKLKSAFGCFLMFQLHTVGDPAARDPVKARRYLEQAVQLDPQNPTLRKLLAEQ